MRKRSPQVQQHALSQPQTNKFHNPYRPANSAIKSKPHKTTRPFNPHNSTSPCISSYTNSQNPILSYSHSLTSSYPHPNSHQPSSPRHNLRRQHTAVQSAPTLHNITTRKISQLQKSNQTQMIKKKLFEKIMNLQHQLDNKAGAKFFYRR